MELHIERRRVTEGNTNGAVEHIASLPFSNGTYPTENGEISLQVGKFNHKKNVQKVVLTSEEFSAKNSANRRVVRFSQRDSLVIHEISKTEQLVFSRSGLQPEVTRQKRSGTHDASADYDFKSIMY